MAHTACLVCFIRTVNERSKKKKPWKTDASIGHITNLKQSIFDFDIHDTMITAAATTVTAACQQLLLKIAGALINTPVLPPVTTITLP
jgi:hypothetical protein